MTTIAIVGRPNVGKSTLFNRFLRKRIAIVDHVSGTTRDRLYGEVEWENRKFNIIDTGGVDIDDRDFIKKQIFEHIKVSIHEADLIVFVVDAKDGLVPMDNEIARILRQSSKKIIIAVNKVDNEKLTNSIYSFSSLGWDKIVGISATHGLGIDKLLDLIIEHVPSEEAKEISNISLKIAIVGRPNVGKSTFVNSVLNEKRMIVDEKPGTTRDAVDIKFTRNNKKWLFIDTAGMRKRKKVKAPLEYYSVTRAYTSIDRADVVILMIDGWEGIWRQDAQILDYVIEKNKPCVIAINKWDLVTKVPKKEYRERIIKRLPEYKFIPAVFISSLKRENIDALLDKMEDMVRQSGKKVSTNPLNKLLHSLKPTRTIKVFYGTQVGVNPPSFLLFVNDPKKVARHYTNYVLNSIREGFGFEVPIKVELRAKKKQQ